MNWLIRNNLTIACCGEHFTSNYVFLGRRILDINISKKHSLTTLRNARQMNLELVVVVLLCCRVVGGTHTVLNFKRFFCTITIHLQGMDLQSRSFPPSISLFIRFNRIVFLTVPQWFPLFNFPYSMSGPLWYKDAQNRPGVMSSLWTGRQTNERRRWPGSLI